MAEPAIINASPLIFLARSRHLDLLHTFASEVWVPETVADEIRQRGANEITAQAIADTEWLITKPSPTTPVTITEWRLGAGESAVLALAAEHQLEAIIDDLAGRKCAAALTSRFAARWVSCSSPNSVASSRRRALSSRT